MFVHLQVGSAVPLPGIPPTSKESQLQGLASPPAASPLELWQAQRLNLQPQSYLEDRPSKVAAVRSPGRTSRKEALRELKPPLGGYPSAAAAASKLAFQPAAPASSPKRAFVPPLGERPPASPNGAARRWDPPPGALSDRSGAAAGPPAALPRTGHGPRVEPEAPAVVYAPLLDTVQNMNIWSERYEDADSSGSEAEEADPWAEEPVSRRRVSFDGLGSESGGSCVGGSGDGLPCSPQRSIGGSVGGSPTSPPPSSNRPFLSRWWGTRDLFSPGQGDPDWTAEFGFTAGAVMAPAGFEPPKRASRKGGIQARANRPSGTEAAFAGLSLSATAALLANSTPVSPGLAEMLGGELAPQVPPPGDTPQPEGALRLRTAPLADPGAPFSAPPALGDGHSLGPGEPAAATGSPALSTGELGGRPGGGRSRAVSCSADSPRLTLALSGGAMGQGSNWMVYDWAAGPPGPAAADRAFAEELNEFSSSTDAHSLAGPAIQARARAGSVDWGMSLAPSSSSSGSSGPSLMGTPLRLGAYFDSPQSAARARSVSFAGMLADPSPPSSLHPRSTKYFLAWVQA